MPFVQVLEPPTQWVRRSLDRRRDLIVGRDEACDLVIFTKSVSRKHARFHFDGVEYCIEDLGSSNGTFVNGRRILRRTPLKHGDRINLHVVPLVFCLHDEENLPSGDAQSGQRTTAPDLPAIPSPEVTVIRGRLHSLVEISRRLGSSLNVDEILPRVLDLLFETFPQATLGEIQLADSEGRLRPVALKRGREDDSAALTHLPIRNDLAEQVLGAGHGTLSTTRGTGDESVLDDHGSSIVCSPMLGPSHRALGTILIETDDLSRAFDNDDLHLVESVGVLAAQALEYSQAHRFVVEHAETRRQMEIARQIQLRMLPPALPTVPGYAFAAHYEPADAVGGDLYFLDHLSDDRLVLGVADACGKSLSAALVMAQFASEVRHCVASCPTVKTALRRLNRFVCDQHEGFITFCLCLVDFAEHTLTVVNAGHLPPIRRKGDRSMVEEIVAERPSLPLGIVPTEDFHPLTVALDPGDEVLIYTDGVIETMTADHQLYGRRRLSQLVGDPRNTTLKSLVSAIVRDIEQFRGRSAHRDDVCMIAFSRVP